MEKYVVIECPVCKNYLALDMRLNRKKCPYCGFINRLGVSRVIKTFKRPREASELVKILNEKPSKESFKRAMD